MASRVLLIEDEPNIAESLKFLLKRSGFEVAVETDGKAGLDRTISEVPDVLVLDVMLPEMDGYEVLRRLRRDARTKDIKVLMLTAKGQPVDRDTAIDYGADRFVTKPYANAEIVDAVQALASGG